MLILVTGASGFVGQHLCATLKHHQYDVLAPSRHELNLLDFNSTQTYLTSYKPDFIFHLAGYVGNIAESIQFPARFYFVNTTMTNHLLQTAITAGCRSLINLSSACAYPANKALLHETDLMNGQLDVTREGYALAKLNGIKGCQFLSRENNVLYKSVIACNLYGPKDHFEPNRSHFIPAVIYKTFHAIKQDHLSLTIWGDGNAKREVLFVSDLIDFLLLTISNIAELPDVVNVGSQNELSINTYYKMIADKMGYSGNFVHDLSHPSGIDSRVLNSSCAKKLGWHPKISIEAGIASTCEWFTHHHESAVS